MAISRLHHTIENVELFLNPSQPACRCTVPRDSGTHDLLMPDGTRCDAELDKLSRAASGDFRLARWPGLGWVAAAFTQSETVAREQGAGTRYFQLGNGGSQGLSSVLPQM